MEWANLFHFNITLGDVFTAIAFIGSAFVFAVRMRGDVLRFAEKLVEMERELKDSMGLNRAEIAAVKVDIKELSSMVSTIAAQNARLDALDRRIDDLVFGKHSVAHHSS